MRQIITAAAVAMLAVSFQAAPAAAEDQSVEDAYKPTCFVKKIRAYDGYGALVVKRIRVCA